MYSLPLVLGLLPLQVYVLLPHDRWLSFQMAMPPSVVFSMWLISGLLAINQPWRVRWEFRLLLSAKMSWILLPLLASFVIVPFQSHDPAFRHAYAQSKDSAWLAVLGSWILGYAIGLATPLPSPLPGTMHPGRVRVGLLLLTVLLPMAVVVWLAVLAMRPVIR